MKASGLSMQAVSQLLLLSLLHCIAHTHVHTQIHTHGCPLLFLSYLSFRLVSCLAHTDTHTHKYTHTRLVGHLGLDRLQALVFDLDLQQQLLHLKQHKCVSVCGVCACVRKRRFHLRTPTAFVPNETAFVTVVKSCQFVKL